MCFIQFTFFSHDPDAAAPFIIIVNLFLRTFLFFIAQNKFHVQSPKKEGVLGVGRNPIKEI